MSTVSPALLAPPEAEPQPTDTAHAVVLRGDGEPKTARGMLAQLATFEEEQGVALAGRGAPGIARGGDLLRVERIVGLSYTLGVKPLLIIVFDTLGGTRPWTSLT